MEPNLEKTSEIRRIMKIQRKICDKVRLHPHSTAQMDTNKCCSKPDIQLHILSIYSGEGQFCPWKHAMCIKIRLPKAKNASCVFCSELQACLNDYKNSHNLNVSLGFVKMLGFFKIA